MCGVNFDIDSNFVNNIPAICDLDQYNVIEIVQYLEARFMYDGEKYSAVLARHIWQGIQESSIAKGLESKLAGHALPVGRPYTKVAIAQ